MIEEFKNLTPEEVNVLYDAPVWVTILIAGADNDIEKKEINEALSLARLKQKRARQALIEYYKQVYKAFEANLNGYLLFLPKDVNERTQILTQNLEKLNKILPKLEKSFAIQYFQSLKDLAEKVAHASGGIMGFLTLGYEEAKLIQLKMIKDPSIQ